MIRVKEKKIHSNILIRDLVLLTLLGLVMTIVFGYTKSWTQFLVVGSFTCLLWILLWKGNSELSNFLETKIDWFNQPVKSLAILSMGTIVYTIGVVFLLMQIYAYIADVNFGDSALTVYSATLITIVISLFMHGRAFLINWKQSALDAEKLKRESVTAQYESLKNQVNPHFLFNSLNALTGLVYEDRDKAAKFIKQLSDVYRYVLDTRHMEVVPIADEIKFLESYLYLQQIRFGDNLKINNELRSGSGNLPPLSLQMLVENVIKHNVISNEFPLTIHLNNNDNKIVVSNNLQIKGKPDENSGGLGLGNIVSRYEFLSDVPVEIVKTADHFEVRLPILNNENEPGNR